MRRAALLALVPVLAGWTGKPSALNPAGPAAEAIANLTWLFVAVLGVIYVLTLLALGWAVLRSRRRHALSDFVALAQERRLGWWVGGAAVATTAILTILVIISYLTDRKLLALQHDPAVEVTLTAHQWWWEINYADPVPAKTFVTANELHLPVGRTAKVTLMSNDVIHSLWLPNVNGKRDIIPGHTETIWLTATEAGEWRGRCAEFCGYQHALMQLDLIVEPQEDFDRWRAAQLLPSVKPATSEEQRGLAVFANYGCMVCHSVRGAPGSGYSGTAPDLTHLKSRRRIAAGLLPNTKGYLAGWVADPQSQKPGVLMPVNLLASEDFQALIAYLETLK